MVTTKVLRICKECSLLLKEWWFKTCASEYSWWWTAVSAHAISGEASGPRHQQPERARKGQEGLEGQ